MTGDLAPGAWPLAGLPEGAAPRPRIYVIDAQGRLLGHDLGPLTSVGRHPDNTIQILDAGMSKFHLRLHRGRGGVVVEDLGSANGTLLNGVPVQRARLRDGDELQVGATRLLFALRWAAPGGRGPALSMLPSRLGAPSAITQIDAADVDDAFPPAEQLRDPARLVEAYQRLRQGHALLRAVASAEDLGAMAEAVLEHAMRQLAVRQGALLLLDESDAVPQLAPLATRARDGADTGELSLPRERVQQLLRERRGLVCEDGAQRAITVPLVDGGQVVGLLHFEGDAAHPAPAAADLAVLSTVARPAALAIANARLLARTVEDARARQALERFLSPTLVEQVRRRDLQLDEDGRACEATILFADIRGFVALAAGLEPEAVVALLNAFFERAVDVVFAHQGVLDKFIGDALMAVWGAAQPMPDHAARALRAALDLRAAVASLNAERRDQGQPPLGVGMGVATGRVVAGRVGSPRRLELTVIGDAVNVASRLCDLAQADQIAVAEATRAAAAGVCTFAELGPRALKGKAQTERVALAGPLDAARGRA